MALPIRMFPPERTYEFFKTLPRELRDKIYDLLSRKLIVTDPRCPGLSTHAPLLVLRLINRQFDQEYLERFLQNDRLGNAIIRDYGNHDWLGVIGPKTPNLIAFTTNMTLYLSACHGYHWISEPACVSNDILVSHREEIDKLVARMPHLRTIRVFLSVPNDSCVRDTLLLLKPITSIAKVVEVKLYAYLGHIRRREDDLPLPPWQREMPTLATWTREHGTVQDENMLVYCLREGYLRSR